MHPYMSHDVAELRGIELRKQADHSRLVASCPRPSAPAHHRRLVQVRRAVGMRLIRAGLRLTTTHR